MSHLSRPDAIVGPILLSIGLSVAAVILAAAIVVAFDYTLRPVLDANGHPVALRGSVR